MEYTAFQRCMEYVNSCGMSYDTLVTDRHTSIAKHMREKLKEVKHYFDLWHLRKSLFFRNALFLHIYVYQYEYPKGWNIV